MAAVHPRSMGTHQQKNSDDTITNFFEASKIFSLQTIIEPQTFSLLSKGPNSNVGTTWPMPTPTKVFAAAADITIDLSSTFAHYSKISLTSNSTTINFTNLIQNRATVFSLDITIDTATFASLIFSPVIQNLPTLPSANGERYLLEITAYKTATEEIFYVTGGTLGSGGVSFPIIPPVNVLGNVSTNQDIDLSLSTAHSTSLTLTGDIDITFSSFPSTGNQIEWEVEITQDGTGGHVITWPSEVINPPSLVTIASSVSIVTFRTNNGGTIVRVGNTVTTTSSGGTGTLSGLTIDVTKDWQGFAITNLTAIQYVDTSANVRGSISGDLGATALRIATASGGKLIISDVITDIATFDDTTGLKIEGSHVINMGNNIINTISELQFSNANIHTPSNENTIAFDSADDALKYAVALTTDSHRFYADTDLIAAFSRIGINEGLLSIQAVTATFLQATETLLLSTFNNTTPTNGEIWRDSGDGKFKFRQNGVTDEIGVQSTIVDGNTSATVLDAAPSFVVVLDGTQRYSISPTRVDYDDLDLFGINQINMTDSSSNDISTLTASATGLLLNIISSSDFYDIQIASNDAFHVDTLRTRILSTSPDTTDPELSLFRDDPSPASGDIGAILFDGRNSVADFITYGVIAVGATNVTDTTESGVLVVNLFDNGISVQQFRLEDGEMTLRKFSTTTGDDPIFNLDHEDSSPSVGEGTGIINFRINDSGVFTTYARIQSIAQEITDAGLLKIQVRSDNTLQDALIIEGNDNSTQFQLLLSSNGNTRMQPLSSAVMGYFVTSQVTDFSLSLGTAGSLEIPRVADGSPSLTDLNQAFGAFDGAFGYESVDERLYVRESSSRWVFFAAAGAVT